MQNSLLKLSSAFFISTLLLTGCGGGGGSSSGGSTPNTDTGTDSGSGSDSGSGGGSGVSNFTPKQSVYLPLISGAGWRYAVESAGSSTETATASTSSDISGPTEQLFKTDTGLLTYYYTSTNTEIEFWGIAGPISQSVEGTTIRVDDFFLDEAVPLWRSSQASGTSIEISGIGATVGAVAGFFSVNVDVELSGSLSNFGATQVTTTYGDIPATRVILSLEGIGEVSGVQLPIEYVDDVYFAKGMGIIYRKTTIGYGGDDVINELRLTSLVNLPEPILFSRSQSDAVLSSSSAVVKFAGGSSLSTTSYEALNATGASWLDLNEETSNQFTVTASGGTIPSTAASEVFYFKATNGSDEIPLNVSIGN